MNLASKAFNETAALSGLLGTLFVFINPSTKFFIAEANTRPLRADEITKRVTKENRKKTHNARLSIALRINVPAAADLKYATVGY